MVQIADILSKVEYVREGESLAKTPEEYKTIYKKRHEAEEEGPDPESPTRKFLGTLQDNGLGQTQPALPEMKLVGRE